VGRSLVGLLSAEGYDVLNVDIHPPPEPLEHEQFQRRDIIADDRLASCFEAARAVVNLAGRQFATPPKPPRRGTLSFFNQVQEVGARHVRDAAVSAGVEALVYVSTDMVYGPPQFLPVTEGHPTRPKGPYGQSKLVAEAVHLEAQSESLAVSVFRPRFIVGAGRFGVLAVLFSWIRRNWPIIIPGNGKNRYMMVGVDDLSRACILALQQRARGVFNIGTEPTPTMGEIIEAVKRHARSRSRILPVPNVLLKNTFRAMNVVGLSPLWPEQYEIADLRYILDLSRVRNELGWRPTTQVLDMNIKAYDAWVRTLIDGNDSGR
jgi:dTDP-glucose 4,6-dehydratase